MIPNIHKLTNALTLRVYPTKQFKAGMLTMSVVLPIHKERAWMTSLLLSVLRRGTERYPTLEAINRRLDYLYGTDLSIRNFYRGDCQVIGFAAEYPEAIYLPEEEDLTRGILEMMCQILFHPQVDENGLLLSRYVESEKQLQCEAIRSLKNNPRAYASEHASEALYADEPCGASIYGTEAEILAITPETLTAYWRELTATLSLDCFYVGSSDTDLMKQYLNEVVVPHLTETNGRYPLPICSQVVREVAKPKRVEESLEVGQGQLVLGFRTGCAVSDDDYYACMIFNEMLGASPISKLFVNVREKLSLCYFCSSSYSAPKGTLLVRCGLLPKNRKKAEKAILAQLQAIAEGDFNEEELIGAKKAVINTYKQAEDSPSSLEGFYFGRAISGAEVSLEECRTRFAAVGRDDVIALAKKVKLDTVYFLNALRVEEGSDDED